jgi:glycine cleavage system aminomethyltransferase T
VSKNIEDYYTSPWELGYDGFTSSTHDFIGKDALQTMAQQESRIAEGDIRLGQCGRDQGDGIDVRAARRETTSSSTSRSRITHRVRSTRS